MEAHYVAMEYSNRISILASARIRSLLCHELCLFQIGSAD